MHHIVIDARSISNSAGTYTERLLHYLQKIDTNNRYTVLLRSADRELWQPTGSNFTVEVADYDNYSIGEQIGLKSLLNRLQPDLVHFCTPWQPIFYKGAHVTTFNSLALLNSHNLNKKRLIDHIRKSFEQYLFKKVLASSRYIITPSKFTKNELIKFTDINANKIAVTTLAADVYINKLEPYNHPFKEYLLYVGQQSDYKNIRRLGDAHQKLLEKHPDLGLILVGKINASASINKKYFESKNYKNILFTGFLPNSQRDWLYTNTSAYVFPSLMEGFGLPGLEAMGYGAPVASSNATCLPEVYGDAAIYFDPNSADDMAKVIDNLLTDQKLRENLIKKGYKQLTKYSWRQTALQTHSVYIDAIRKYVRI